MQQRDAAEVYRELAGAVLGYLRAQRLADAEDVLGEVFLQVARDLSRFDGDDAALRRWVFTIAHNRALDEFRKHARRPQVVDREPPERPAEPPDDPFDQRLVDALGCLTSEQREVLLLRFVADLSLEQVARITSRSVGAVKTMQRRALARLQRLVSPDPSLGAHQGEATASTATARRDLS